MNYRQRNSRNESRGKYGILAAVFLFLLAGILFRNTGNRVVAAVFSPLWKLSAMGVNTLGGALEPFSFKSSLIAQNESLKKENAALQEELIDYQRLKSENDLLSRELLRKPSSTSHLAAVVLQPPRVPYDTLVVDQGAQDGVSVGDTVVAGDGVQIGEIAEADAHTSKVSLYSTSGIETKGIIRGSVIPVTLVGRGGGTFEVKVPQEITISDGDTILSLSEKFSLALVGSVEADGASAYRRVLAKSAVNLSTVRSVFIIPSNAPSAR